MGTFKKPYLDLLGISLAYAVLPHLRVQCHDQVGV